MIDLSTQYMGIRLKNPLIPSSSPLSREIGNLRQMEDSGASAIVLDSIFEEQFAIEGEDLDLTLTARTDRTAECQSYYPELEYKIGPERYLKLIREAKESLEIPVIASLNGTTPQGWTEYSRQIEQAGADALELNIYFVPTDFTSGAVEIEDQYTRMVRAVSQSVKIPISVKIGPFFTSMGHMATQLVNAGARGLVLFNRFYHPDIDIETLNVVPKLALSQPDELALRLHWAAVLYGKIKADVAITGGVHRVEDVLKAMMAGARVAMMTSTLYTHGIGYLKELEAGLRHWLEQHEYESIRQMQGSLSAMKAPNPAVFSRVNYMKILSAYAEQPVKSRAA